MKTKLASLVVCLGVIGFIQGYGEVCVDGGGDYYGGQLCVLAGLPNGGNGDWQLNNQMLCCEREEKPCADDCAMPGINGGYPVTTCSTGCCFKYGNSCLCWTCYPYYPADHPECAEKGCKWFKSLGCYRDTPGDKCPDLPSEQPVFFPPSPHQ